jgi:hypothetical protein
MIPYAVKGIFLLPPSAFFARREFFPANRIGMGKNSDMVGKIPPWKWDMVGVCSPPPKKKIGGRYTLAGGRGGWGVNILEDERHRIALLQL